MDRFARMIDLTPDDVAGALAPMGTGATGYVFPILPPLMSPQQPAWKQEARQEAAPEPQAQPVEKPAASDKPEPSGENQ